MWGLHEKKSVAKAGPDQVITLPTDSVSLDGRSSSDPGGAISSFLSKISGPSSFNISNNNAVQTQIISFAEGIYQFKLAVTDNRGLATNDTVKLTINPPTMQHEVVTNSLTWHFWHDPNGIFDEVYLYLPGTSNILSNIPLNIFVKLDSTNDWIPVNPVINGNCTTPYSYFIISTANNHCY